MSDAAKPPVGREGPRAGLSSTEAARLLALHGPNAIQSQASTPTWQLFLLQFRSPVVGLLLGACVVAAALREVANAVAIAAIVVLNAVVGFVQEHRAENAVRALRSLTAPRARVVRDGHASLVPAAEVVRGDLLALESGDVVAADARVLEARRLSANEAALTGESMPVEKSTAAVREGAPLSQRSDTVFMGTAIATGTGLAEVIATGMRAELGRIAHLLDTAQDDATPLQTRLSRTSRVLLYACLAIVAVVAALGVLRGQPMVDVFVAAVALAVAAVPEGLPAVVTIALAVGVQRMAKRNVLVRRMASIEGLGCATVICTDKTGTLTTGVMRVRETWGADVGRLLDAAAACCDAELRDDGQDGAGDPTEVAILVEAAAHGIHRADIERARPRVDVMPFDPDLRCMWIRRADGVVYVKGAIEVVLARCASGVQGAHEENQRMAARGLRVLAVAVGTGPDDTALQLLGLLGIADPPRPEAIAAIAAARAAGITTVMITGDHPVTAHAIAREMGLGTGASPGAADASAPQWVHARATPEDKLRIVRDWKARGAVVAMTGDGVNDAPALREAHVGIAMGRSGTEVTREAADVVLADDNFASIVAGVGEGRITFDNIRKTLVYLLTGNAAELTVMLVAAAIGLPLPLLPLQLLWINLVTDGLPALALVVDPAQDDVLQRPPKRPDEAMLRGREWARVVTVGALEALVTLAVFTWGLAHHDLAEARSFAFSTLVFAELFRALSARSTTRTWFEVGPFTNPRLFAVVALSAAAQFGVQHLLPVLHWFEIGALDLAGTALTVAAGLVPVSAIELAKLVQRNARASSAQSMPTAGA